MAGFKKKVVAAVCSIGSVIAVLAMFWQGNGDTQELMDSLSEAGSALHEMHDEYCNAVDEETRAELRAKLPDALDIDSCELDSLIYHEGGEQ